MSAEQIAGTSIRPTPDCGGPRKPPGATELWWCDTHGEFHGPPVVIEIDRTGISVYGAIPALNALPPMATSWLEQAREIARQLWENVRTGAAYPDALDNRIRHAPELYWMREERRPASGLEYIVPVLLDYEHIEGQRHRHGLSAPQPHWRDHSHLFGDGPHGHDPVTGLQVAIDPEPVVHVIEDPRWNEEDVEYQAHCTCGWTAEGDKGGIWHAIGQHQKEYPEARVQE